MDRALRRIILMCLVMAQLVLLTSCDREDDKETLVYASDNHFEYAASEEGLFYADDGLIHFVSAETHEDIIFCFDPVCEHERATASNPDPTCHAALFDGRTKIAYYDGYIYYWTVDDAFNHSLYRMDINAGTRKKLGSYPYNFNALGYVFYDDYVYYNAKIMQETYTGGGLKSRAVLLEVKLADGSSRVIVEREDESNYAVSQMDRRDNMLLAVMDDEAGDYLARIDLETLEKTVVVDANSMKEQHYYYRGIYDSESYYYSTISEIGICNLTTGKKTVIAEAGKEKFIALSMASNQGVMYSIWDEGNESCYFYDVAGKQRWDITDKYKELGIWAYNGYMDKFITQVIEETDGGSRIVGYDIYDVQEVLAECKKIK